MLKKKNFVHFVSRPPGRNLLKHIFWQKYSRVFQSSEVSKVWKIELCTFCEPPVCWNITQNHLLTTAEDFSLKSLKVWKSWKTNFGHFVSRPLGEKLPKHICWQKWRILKGLKLQNLENSNFAHFVTANLVKNYPNIPLTKIWIFKNLKKQTDVIL